ncbi:ammonium transporter [Tistlia consotensis]|uniref:Ammonium transporter n=1 Tax=Tistlia consotensis USBA 355 TaxID=560819 RepID=A0A1Y6CG14_9PROT|nr:ammonium transporter [Tistlia consotensis]SMF54379.1 ammonium transporter [Tistlia consotensis USBA 355]SNR86884.1 ammonium transporter [Tistlia consotensis]
MLATAVPVRPGRRRLRAIEVLGGALGGLLLLLAAPHVALAEDATLSGGDTAWMLTSTALVLMMTVPGLFLFYAGMVRKKNVLAMCMQVFATCCLVTIIWMIVGYSLAFSGEGAYIGDLGRFFLAGMGVDTLKGTIPESVFMMFQMTFAIITPALIVGAFADRMKFSALLWFMGLWSILVYPVVCHWVWGAGGWVGGLGALDFAGGTVVHINAGIAGLVTTLVLGKRMGYGQENMAPHNLVLTMIGASLLWVGWFGFNAGSELAADGRAGMAMTVTQIATGMAALAWMFAEWLKVGKPSVLGIASGAVAGLVAITPASGFVGPGGALAIGIAAGVICYLASTSLKNALGYDDSLDVFGVHAVGGIVGALLTGVFAVESIGGTPGLLEGNPGQVWTQLLAVLATIVWSGLVSWIILMVIDKTIGLRVSPEVERDGLDIGLHGETVH